MKRRLSFYIVFSILYLEAYAQNIFFANSYYSQPDEVSVEIHNLANREMVLLVDRGSYVNLYHKPGQYKSGKLMNHDLKATDSLNVLIKIPAHKIYVARYKVKDVSLAKLHLMLEYSLDFISPPASNKWEKASQEMSILPYDSQRESVKRDMLIDKKEQISGEYVYRSPEIMPEFPGGEKGLRSFLDKETYAYSYDSQDMAYVRVRVIIEKDGRITHPYLLQGRKTYFQQAALEIIRRMPKWTPGFHKGKPVRTFYVIPILFRLV